MDVQIVPMDAHSGKVETDILFFPFGQGLPVTGNQFFRVDVQRNIPGKDRRFIGNRKGLLLPGKTPVYGFRQGRELLQIVLPQNRDGSPDFGQLLIPQPQHLPSPSGPMNLFEEGVSLFQYSAILGNIPPVYRL